MSKKIFSFSTIGLILTSVHFYSKNYSDWLDLLFRIFFIILTTIKNRVIFTVSELDFRINHNLPKRILLLPTISVPFYLPRPRIGCVCTKLPSKKELAPPKLLANLDSVCLPSTIPLEMREGDSS